MASAGACRVGDSPLYRLLSFVEALEGMEAPFRAFLLRLNNPFEPVKFQIGAGLPVMFRHSAKPQCSSRAKRGRDPCLLLQPEFDQLLIMMQNETFFLLLS